MLLKFSVAADNVSYVRPSSDSDCSRQPCLTIDQYVQQTDEFFTTGSTVVFLAGNHTMTTLLNITNASNITLRAENAKLETSIVWKDKNAIICENVSNMTLEGLIFRSDFTTVIQNLSTLQFINSQGILITNTKRLGHDAVIKGMAVQGVLSSFSSLTIKNCHFKDNVGNYGGALHISNSNATLMGNTFVKNRARYEGGAIFADKKSNLNFEDARFEIFSLSNSVTVKNDSEKCVQPSESLLVPGLQLFAHNTADKGGAIYLTQTSAILSGRTIVFSNNIAYRGGGGIVATRNTVVWTDVRCLYFISNRAKTRYGGAIYVDKSNFTLSSANTLNRQYFNKNSAKRKGGGIFSESGHLIVMGYSLFEGNLAEAQNSVGGAIRIESTTISLMGSVEFKNNSAKLGGAMYFQESIGFLNGTSIEFVNNSANANGGCLVNKKSELLIIAQEVIFKGNTATNKGGCIYISFNGGTQPVEISGHFSNNRAREGGAIYTERGDEITWKNVSIEGSSTSAVSIIDSKTTFTGTTTIHNNTGGGIYMVNSQVKFLDHTTFERNSARKGGAINSLSGMLLFSGITVFAHNRAVENGGAVYTIGTNVTFQETVNATFNSAKNGGAFYLTNMAYLTILEKTTLSTSHNHASQYGGAIYYEDTPTLTQCSFAGTRNTISLPYCFIDLKDIHLVRNNVMPPLILISYNDTSAEKANYLFGGLLDRCYLRVEVPRKIRQIKLPYGLVTEVLSYVDMQANDTIQRISSKPYQLCFCESNRNEYNCNTTENRAIFRGQSFAVSLIAKAQGGVPTNSSVIAMVNPTARLKLNQSLQAISKQCTRLEYTLYSTNNHGKLTLYADGPCHDTGLAKAVVNVEFRACPSGFVESGETCTCEKRLQKKNVQCTIDSTIQILKLNDSKLWMRALYANETYRGFIFSTNCPSRYCKTGLVNISMTDSDVQCDHNRSGVLCGACCTNYSLMLGSTQCGECSNAYLTLLLPFAAAGIALVVFLSVLRLTVATGMINSIILYANIVQVNRNLLLPTSDRNVLTVFVSWMNLDLGFKTCFYKGMTKYAQTWLQFVFPVYVWTLIALIIIASRYSLVISKFIGRNPVAVLATLLLMSYTKIMKIIVDVYSFVYLDYPENKTVAVWLKDANVPYLRSWHLLLTLVTSVVLVFFFFPYTILLLLGYKLCHYSDKRCFRWLNRLKPLLDCYYGPYKPHTRYWTGFLLLIRAALYAVFLFNSQAITSAVLSLTLTALVAKAWLLGRLYSKLCVDFIESSVYLNLVVLSILSLSKCNSAVYSHALVGIILATMLGIIIYHFHIYYTPKRVRAVLQKVMRVMRNCKKNKNDTHGGNLLSYEISTVETNITSTSIELREPLLSD